MITLFQHQQQALDLTEGHNRCAYYLDMGLGKTFVGSEKALTLNSRVSKSGSSGSSSSVGKALFFPTLLFCKLNDAPVVTLNDAITV